MLAGAATVFALIVLINLKLEVWPVIKGGWLSGVLQADITGTVASDLLVGLFSAYVFYVFMELVPRNKREEESVAALNLLLNTISYKYTNADPFRRAVRSRDIDPTLLSSERLSSIIVELDSDKGKFDKLKHMAEEAARRLPDLLSSYNLAVGVSHEKGVLWMEIADATRSLCECHEFLKDANKASLDIVTNKEKLMDFRRQQTEFYQDKKEGLRIVMQARAKEWFKLVSEWEMLRC